MSKLPRVIAFIGPIGAGKSTAAQALKPLGYHRISFADPLKQMLMTLGLTHTQVYGDEKELPTGILGGKTPRWAMQTLGTEWGRQQIHPDLWARVWQFKCQSHQLVTVDDLRFPNEYQMVKSLNGVIIRILRPGPLAAIIGHESETHTLQADAEILNGGSIARFNRDVMFTAQSLAS